MIWPFKRKHNLPEGIKDHPLVPDRKTLAKLTKPCVVRRNGDRLTGIGIAKEGGLYTYQGGDGVFIPRGARIKVTWVFTVEEGRYAEPPHWKVYGAHISEGIVAPPRSWWRRLWGFFWKAEDDALPVAEVVSIDEKEA